VEIAVSLSAIADDWDLTLDTSGQGAVMGVAFLILVLLVGTIVVLGIRKRMRV
jgi:hypothetical protein